MELPKAQTRVEFEIYGEDRAKLRFSSDAFQHAFTFDLAKIAYTASDNGFDLYPQRTKEIELRFDSKITVKKMKNALSFRSLFDSYV